MRSGVWMWISWRSSIELIVFAVDIIRRIPAYSLFHSNGECLQHSPWLRRWVDRQDQRDGLLSFLPIWNVQALVFEMSRLGLDFLPVLWKKKWCIPVSARIHSRRRKSFTWKQYYIFFTPFSAKTTKWEKKVYRVVFLILFLFSTVGSETHLITRIRINIIHKRVCQKW